MTEQSAVEVARHRRATPSRSEQPSQHFPQSDERRTQAGQSIAQALEALPTSTWTVLHDIRWPGRHHANIDHVVIGPSGVFVIDALDWRGLVHVWENTLYHDGAAQEREIADAGEAASAVAVLTPGVQRHAVWPVLSLLRDESLTGQAGHVLVCSTATIVELLESQVHVLSSEQRRVAVKQLQDRLHDASSVRVASKVAHTTEKRSARQLRRAKAAPTHDPHSTIKRKKSSSGSLIPLLMLIGTGILFIGFPGAVLDAAGAVRDLVQQLPV